MIDLIGFEKHDHAAISWAGKASSNRANGVYSYRFEFIFSPQYMEVNKVDIYKSEVYIKYLSKTIVCDLKIEGNKVVIWANSNGS